ncbi:MAG: AarF/UbiB family protein [Acidobacteriota bacterium]
MAITTGSALRLVQLLRVLVRHGIAHGLGGAAVRRPWLARRLPMAGESGPVRLRMLIEDFGGTFVKFGQMLALQPDILPVLYCNALFKLLDRVEPFPYAEVDRTIREELGQAPEAIFDHLDATPLATASVGQVHIGFLDGQKVAVKIQRPNVETEFSDDIRLMAAALSVIRGLRIRALYWMLEPMQEFIDWTSEELDYRHEARCSETLRRQVAGRSGQYVPRVFDHLTTRRTLVVEFLDGFTLLDVLRASDQEDELTLHRLRMRGFDRRQVAANVIDNFLANAFEHGMYHADLHPANLMILDGNVVGYIDFGITGVMNIYARRHLMQMTLALARGDMDLFHEQFLRVTSWDEDSDLPGFRAGLDDLAADWYDEGPDGPRLVANFTRVMTEMLHLSRRNAVMPERNVIKYIRSSIAIDGLVTRFEPDFDLSSYLADRCSRYLRWQRRSHFFDADRLLDLTDASARLLHAGPTRGARALQRLASSDLPVQLQAAGRELAAERGQAIQLAVVLLVAGLVVSRAPDAAWGVNLLTVALVIVLATATALVRSLWRLA